MKAAEVLKYGHLAVLVTGLAFGGMTIEPAYAQSTGGQGQGQGDGDGDGNADGPGNNPNDIINGKSGLNPYDFKLSRRATPDATVRITKAIRGSYDFCARVRDKAYLVDCLGERLEDIAKRLPRNGDYAEARKILLDTGKKLRRLAAANKAPAKPRTRVSGVVVRKKVTTKPLTAVRAEKIKQVNQQAVNILAEAETKLLRSAGASDRRLIAYAQMAKAVGSNKTLLRSA